MNGVKKLMLDNGVFISENHYLLDLINTLQYDTIYHEHLRYYSLHSLKNLFELHDLEIFHVERIPTHGGSIRVYANKKGQRKIKTSVKQLFDKEIEAGVDKIETYKNFALKSMQSKLDLLYILKDLKSKGNNL